MKFKIDENLPAEFAALLINLWTVIMEKKTKNTVRRKCAEQKF